jgi:hypothetical protein
VAASRAEREFRAYNDDDNNTQNVWKYYNILANIVQYQKTILTGCVFGNTEK